MIQRYGQTDVEKLAEEKHVCRQIVKELSNFEISQRQRLFIIYLLALEIEDVEKMKSLTTLVRDLGGEDVFIVDRSTDDADV